MFESFPGGKPPLEDFISSWYPILIAVGIGFIVGLRNYMKGCPNPCADKMDGKVVVVTGANSGMGKEMALDYALRGAKVILACRSKDKGIEAAKEIAEKSKSKDVHFMELDLGNLRSVADFVKSFKAGHEKLNLLVNNAGVMSQPKALTAQDNDYTFQVNYLGHFFLTHLLADRLTAASPSRIINVACHAYRIGELDFEDINFEKRLEADYKSGDMYAQSKLAVVMFTRQMAKYLEGSNVTCNCVSPGVVNTELYRDVPLRTNTFFRYSFSPITWLFMKPPVDGAQTGLYVSLSKDEEGVSGKLYNECKIKEVEGLAGDDDACKRLWDLSFKLVGIDPPSEEATE